MNTVYICAVVVGIVACATDLRTRRIPNVLTFGSAALGIAFHIVTHGAVGLLESGTGWLLGLAVFFVPFALGGLGAGDVKLLAALGAWLGPGQVIWVALYAGIAGGVLAVSVALLRGYLGQALVNIQRLLGHWQTAGLQPLHDVSLQGGTGPRLAYAVPIFLGVVFTIWLR